MKTRITQAKRAIQRLHFNGIKIIPVLATILIVLLYGCTTPFMVSSYPDGGYTAPPTWAQNYDTDNPVNYYYLPDIESYYDLRNREFVYLENGSWRFSTSLPLIYASFDLNNCFIVKLDNTVHEPWMHFHYYVAHYPRYYYKSYDRDRSDNPDRPPRWFNENLNHYGYENDGRNMDSGIKNERRAEPRFSHEPSSNYNNRSTNKSDNRNEVRQNNVPRQDQNNGNYKPQGTNREGDPNSVRQIQVPTQKPSKEGAANREQPMKYYGRQIGQPVKVQRNMMKPKEDKRQTKTQERKGRDR